MSKSIGVAFDQYIADDIAKYAGVTMPVKAGFFNRIMVTKAMCTDLHPNPEDEFSIPSVGPSYRIISEYEKKYIYNSNHSMNYFNGEEPIMVEKIRPDGYMILNGHHRWAAALKIMAPSIAVILPSCFGSTSAAFICFSVGVNSLAAIRSVIAPSIDVTFPSPFTSPNSTSD